MRSLEHRIPPPLLIMLTGLAMGLAAHWNVPLPIPAWLRYGMAGVFLIGGGLIGPPAIRRFNRAGTTINPVRIDQASALVTTGIYGRTRNPMYVGLTALLLALAAVLGNLWAMAGPVLFALFITRFQILPEERVMQAKFGQAYLDYKARVRRWL